MAQNANSAGQTHDQLQAACYAWACREYHPYVYRRLIAIPNDMHVGNVVRWKQYEAMGVTAGVWDMQFLWFTTKISLPYPEIAAFNQIKAFITPAVYWWEFKVGADTLSKKKKDGTGGQIEFRESLLPFGHVFNIATEEHEFKEQFKLIIEPTLKQVKELSL